MAIIQSIRNRAGLLVAVVIGGALVAFILGDFITSGGFLMDRARMSVAEINGKKIQFPEYQRRIAHIEEMLKIQYGNTQSQELVETARTQAWQDLLQDYLLDDEYEKLGLAISDAELSNLVQGNNPHPIVVQMFTNPQTGQLDRLQLAEFISNLSELDREPKLIWSFYENQIVNERLFTKYHNLVRKGLYVNSLEAEKRQEAMAVSADISFIQKPYTAISDSAVEVSEAEMKKYYKEHRERYKQEATRSIKYVAFEKKPSEDDYREAELWLEDQLGDFKTTKRVETFVNSLGNRFDRKHYAKGELPDSLDAFMFSAEVGDVYGPYFEDDAYKAAKLAKISYLPDSIRVSHILLPANQQNARQMQFLADSLKTLANNGYNFAELVQDNSRDVQTYIQNGDLGWIEEGYKGQAFSDSVFAAEIGEAKITFSQDGFHVIKVTDKSKPVKKVQVGIISSAVTPGAATDEHYYKMTIDFLNANKNLEDFEASTRDGNPAAIPVYGIQPLDKEIQGLEDSREIVQWAFSDDTREGDIFSSNNDYGDKYVVAVLVKKNEAGYSSFEDVKSGIELEIRKQKKAAMIISEFRSAMADAGSIDNLGASMNLPVKSASGVRFSSFQIREAGNEPKLIAAAVTAETGTIQGPIDGENGVYVLTVENRETNEDASGNLAIARSYIDRSYAARANRRAFEILRELAEIEDHRVKFY